METRTDVKTRAARGHPSPVTFKRAVLFQTKICYLDAIIVFKAKPDSPVQFFYVAATHLSKVINKGGKFKNKETQKKIQKKVNSRE